MRLLLIFTLATAGCATTFHNICRQNCMDQFNRCRASNGPESAGTSCDMTLNDCRIACSR